MATLRQYLAQFGNPNHVINGFGQENAVELDTEVKEASWGSTSGTGQLQHWCRYGAVILRFTLHTFPEYTAYLIHDDSAGAQWDFGRLNHVRRYANDYKYTDTHGSRPFATLRLVLGELERTKKHRSSDRHQNVPMAYDLPDLT